MKTTTTKKIKKQVVSKVTCDICGCSTENPEINNNYDNDFSEYININVNAGYNSKYFTDGLSFGLDMCEKCFSTKVLPLFKTVTFNSSFNFSEKEIKNMTIDDI